MTWNVFQLRFLQFACQASPLSCCNACGAVLPSNLDPLLCRSLSLPLPLFLSLSVYLSRSHLLSLWLCQSLWSNPKHLHLCAFCQPNDIIQLLAKFWLMLMLPPMSLSFFCFCSCYNCSNTAPAPSPLACCCLVESWTLNFDVRWLPSPICTHLFSKDMSPGVAAHLIRPKVATSTATKTSEC